MLIIITMQIGIRSIQCIVMIQIIMITIIIVITCNNNENDNSNNNNNKKNNNKDNSNDCNDTKISCKNYNNYYYYDNDAVDKNYEGNVINRNDMIMIMEIIIIVA